MLKRNLNTDAIRARWLLLAGFLVVLALHLPALGGYFTSDTFGLVRHCATLSQDGNLWTWMVQNFWRGLDVDSHYYRPLSSASLCLDYQLYGAHPLGWRITQLVLHLLNGWLLYRLASALAGDGRLRQSIAAIAALLFWFSPASPEVSLWVAGRYNALAMLFMLLAVIAQSRAQPYRAALWLALALCSKESAMVTPVLLATLAWWRHTIENGPTPGLTERITNSWRELWPSALIFAAYLGLRWSLFGDPFSVYPNSHNLLQQLNWDLLSRFNTLGQTLLAAWREQPILQTVFWLILGTALLTAALRARQQHRWLALWGLPALWLLISVVALLPHLQTLSSAGQGSRLLYSASAWAALAITLPWAEYIGWQTQQRRFLTASLILLGLTLLLAQYPAQRDWTRAVRYPHRLLPALAHTATTLPDHHWALVLVPDHLGTALAARNAQGALVLPPFQAESLLHHIVPLVPQDLRTWRQRLQHGVDWLQANLNRTQARWPQAVYCAHPQTGALIPLNFPTTAPAWRQLADAPDLWRQQWRQALSGTACEVYL